MKNELYQKEVAKKFYENRYEKGYMDDWPKEKKERVLEIIQNLPLPETGNALDFGCGNGVYTEVLKQALPKWNVYGCDISSISIENANNRLPQCSFFVSDNEVLTDLKFDLLFSHHVLEHVFDIEKTIDEINAYLKPVSSVLHIFPCGNMGSFEQKICALRTGGVNPNMENRFFFEDEGHVRRLTTEETSRLMFKHGFALESNFYSNQHWGAIKWISQSPFEFILSFTNSDYAIDKKAKEIIKKIRCRLILSHFIQLPAILFNSMKNRKNKKLKHYLALVIGFIPFLFSYPFFANVNKKAKNEWEACKKMRNGSEMYLYYCRQQEQLFI